MSSDPTNTPPPNPASRFIPAGIRVSPNIWPGKKLAVQPGDPTQFVPMGCCFNAPIVMRPWDTLDGALKAQGYYGGQGHSFHPLHGAPTTESSGGILYFDSGQEIEEVLTALRLMHAPLCEDRYAVFVSDGEDPQKDGYLVHCRIIPSGALAHFFGAEGDHTEPPQPMMVEGLIRGFIELHEKRYGTGMSPDLYGAMGGDGDWAKESLCFGFMVENEYYGICRIWSRAWLVTK
jgi:hypothetical protein